VYVSVGLSLFLVDNVDMSVSVFGVHTYSYSNSLTDYANGFYSLSAGMNYSFVSGASDPLVPRLGASLGLSLDPGSSGKASGVPFDDQSLSMSLSLSPEIRLNYFISDRWAVYLSLTPALSLSRQLFDVSGASVADPGPIEQRLTMRVTVAIGLARYLPPRLSALFPTE
jgi:hypothetical protein